MSDLEVFVCIFRKGYEAAAKGFDPQDLDVSVVGRSFMITGANSGIGRAAAMAVAQKGRLSSEPSCAVGYGASSTCVCFQVGLSTWCVGTKREQRRPGR